MPLKTFWPLNLSSSLFEYNHMNSSSPDCAWELDRIVVDALRSVPTLSVWKQGIRRSELLQSSTVVTEKISSVISVVSA